MRSRLLAMAMALGAAPSGAALAADEPVAIVEEVAGNPDGLAAMDFLAAGRTIRLGAGQHVTIDYLASCTRETVKGGTITIGAEQSAVTGGTVHREKVQCEGASFQLSSDQAAQSGAVVFRGKPPPTVMPKPAHLLYGRSPLIEIGAARHVLIERLDLPGERLDLTIPEKQVLRGTWLDLAKSGHALVAGGLYRVTADDRSTVFKIDPAARSGATPPAGRLLHF
jgi:hypothetical protein